MRQPVPLSLIGAPQDRNAGASLKGNEGNLAGALVQGEQDAGITARIRGEFLGAVIGADEQDVIDIVILEDLIVRCDGLTLSDAGELILHRLFRELQCLIGGILCHGFLYVLVRVGVGVRLLQAVVFISKETDNKQSKAHDHRDRDLDTLCCIPKPLRSVKFQFLLLRYLFLRDIGQDLLDILQGRFGFIRRLFRLCRFGGFFGILFCFCRFRLFLLRQRILDRIDLEDFLLLWLFFCFPGTLCEVLSLCRIRQILEVLCRRRIRRSLFGGFCLFLLLLFLYRNVIRYGIALLVLI